MYIVMTADLTEILLSEALLDRSSIDKYIHEYV